MLTIMKNRLQKIQIRIALMIVIIISALAALLASSLMTRMENVMRRYVMDLVATDSRQLELNIDNYIDEVENTVALMFADDKYYGFDPTDESIDDYTKIQEKDEIGKRIVDLGLMKNYSDFAIVYSNDDTIGWMSQTTNALFPDGGIYDKFAGCITDNKTADSWIFGVNGNTERLYYTKRLNQNAVVVVSFYGKELESVFRYPEELKDMSIDLVDSNNCIMYSSDEEEIGNLLPDKIAALAGNDGRSCTLDNDYLVASDTCSNGWRVVCSIPADEVLAMSSGQRQFTIIYTIAIAVVFCAIILFLYNRFSRPVNGIVSNLNEKASTDQLTGLLNKSTFQFLVDEQMKQKGDDEGIAFAMFDLDNFKKINDTFGHPYGDEVLVKTGHLMAGTFGQDHLIGRIGGDEFAICLYYKNKDIDDIKKQAEKEMEKFSTDFKKEFEGNADIDFSAGIVKAADSETAFDQVYKRADELLYRSKNSGKGRISYDW